jgi:hypothetical protein
MNIPAKYVELFNVDINDIKSFIHQLTDEQWNAWNLRQKKFDFHSKTKTYPLSWATDLGNNNYIVSIKNKFDNIWDILTPIIQNLENYYDGRCLNVMFANLPSGEEIKAHVDNSDLLKSIHRCHLPIQTNEDVIFYLDRQPYHLKEGIFYEINNTILHSVSNNSSEDRVHLIIDIIPNCNNSNIKFICE